MLETVKTSDPSLVYMYGLSDFWVDMFGDTQLVETILAGETVQLAEAYSYFLQRAAGISLTDIQSKYQTRIKLLLLGESDLVDSSDLTKFNLDSSILDITKLANRPVLPTQTLSDGIHYDIDSNVLTLYKPIDELKFPVRYNSDGSWQYALWMCDVEVDGRWLDTTFGRLVGFTEDDAIFNYKSFLEGVYYLYTNGPNISYIVRGVNLAMGMPYARDTEEVLDMSVDSMSSNWVIFTANNSYEIPYAYRPDLSVGDILTEGEVLSTWVKIRDYSTSGAWWYQVYLPREVLGDGVEPFTLGKAVEGSKADAMMNNFLKHHMFEVLITQPSSDITAFNTAKELVLTAKPEYTYPIFVWKADIDDEEVHLDDTLRHDLKSELQDYCISAPSVRYMDRSVEVDDFSRGTHWYNRVQGSTYAAGLIGYGDWIGNAGWAPQFDSIQDNYLSYMDVILRTRGDKVTAAGRGVITRGWRGHVSNTDSEGNPLDDTPVGITWTVSEDNVFGGTGDISINERDLTPLYMLSLTELVDKMLTVDSRFSVGDRTRIAVTGLNLVDGYDTWMVRNSSIDTSDLDEPYSFAYSEGDLDIAFSPFAYQTYVPSKDLMYDEDGMPRTDGTILLTKTTRRTWVAQWAHSQVINSPTLFPVEDQDWTRAIEQYGFEDIGEDISYNGLAIGKEVYRTQTPMLVDGTQDILVIVDGSYVSILDYDVEIETSRAEKTRYNEDDDSYVDLGIPSRSYLNLSTAPMSSGYLVYEKTGTFLTTEERVYPEEDGTFTLSESPSRTDILVITDDGFEFDYSIAGNILTVNTSPSSVYVRYVDHTEEQTFPAGESVYTLDNDSHCKIFVGSRLLEDWAYTRVGTTITLPSSSSEILTVRYHESSTYTKVSAFNRSTIERNKATFLMDRGSESGEYDDLYGQTVFMNRGGAPTLEDGSFAETVNVIRRLR